MGRLVDESGRVVELQAVEVMVGRHEDCQIRLADPYCSAFHAALRWTGSTWQVRDLGSTNGTYLNGERLSSTASPDLSEGDVVHFGRNGGALSVLDVDGPEEVGESTAPGPDVIQVDIAIRVAWQEIVSVEYSTTGTRRSIEACSHHRLLLELASPGPTWRAVADLCALLGIDQGAFNQYVYRLRKELDLVGAPVSVIERPRGSAKVRICRANVRVDDPAEQSS